MEMGGGTALAPFIVFDILTSAVLTMTNFPEKDPANIRRSCKCAFCTNLKNDAARRDAARVRRVNGVVPVLRVYVVGERYISTCWDRNELLCADALRSRRPR